MPRIRQSQQRSGMCSLHFTLSPRPDSVQWRLKSGGMWDGKLYTTATNRCTPSASGDFEIECPPSDAVGALVVTFPGGKRAEVTLSSPGEVFTLQQLNETGDVRWL